MAISEREGAVLQTIEASRDELVETLAELIRINTVNPYSGEDDAPGEKPGQDALEPHLKALGAKTWRFEPSPDTFEAANVIGPKGRSWNDRPNLVAEWTFGTGTGPTVIILGHMDTVGVQGMDNPFGAEIRGGRMYGRGTTDCKGGLVSGLGAVKGVLERAEDLDGRLIYLSVVDEECDGSGAGTIACALKGIKGNAAISVDGTSNEVIRGCGGVVTAEVRVRGQAGHASVGNGVSAIDKAIQLTEAIHAFGEARHSSFPECLLNIGTFRGGTAPAVIADSARMSLNIVYHKTEAEAGRDETGVWGGRLIWDAFEKTIRAAEAKDEWLRQHPSELIWVKDLVPYEVPADADAIRETVRAASDVTGKDVPTRKIILWTDSCWMQVLADTPIALHGPGVHTVAHGPDEYVELDTLVTTAKSIGLSAYRMLSRP